MASIRESRSFSELLNSVSGNIQKPTFAHIKTQELKNTYLYIYIYSIYLLLRDTWYSKKSIAKSVFVCFSENRVQEFRKSCKGCSIRNLQSELLKKGEVQMSSGEFRN